jgi:spore maturation protein CgeB
MKELRIVVLGLSITSTWGNGHATTYRALVRALARRGHDVLFLERDVPWYAANRDLRRPPFCRTALYGGVDELDQRFGRAIAEADLAIVGSYVPDGIAVGERVLDRARGATAFYDIDTPVTLARLERGDCAYLAAPQVPRYDLYLSFTGGPTLRRIERELGSPAARPLYCSVDPDEYGPDADGRRRVRIDLGYMGTYSRDRQRTLRTWLLAAARAWPEGRFLVAGPKFPSSIRWPANVRRVEHLAAPAHRAFYNRQRFTLNVTRADMRVAGWSPSVRLFEAAACGTPVISDGWPGIEEFFEPELEILVARRGTDVLRWLRSLDEDRRRELGAAARRRVLAEHTADHRAETLERHAAEVLDRRARGALALAGAAWSGAWSGNPRGERRNGVPRARRGAAATNRRKT